MAYSLLQRVHNLTRLRLAWSSLNKSNSNSKGLHGGTIEEFSKELEKNLRVIKSKLRENKYSFSLLKGVPKLKKDSTKAARPLKIPIISDRVVLKAIAMTIEGPLRLRYKIENTASFAYQKELGVRQALERVRYFYDLGFHFALKSYIKSFFDAINPRILLDEMVYPALPDTSLNF